jgi:ABC-type antimicrobial peptide transport system permease subunit
LGARSRDIINHVIGRGTVLVAAGLAVGVCGAVVLTRLIRGLLFGVEPLDATTFALVCALFATAATAAAWIPARRAARVDPMLAMRAE